MLKLSYKMVSNIYKKSVFILGIMNNACYIHVDSDVCVDFHAKFVNVPEVFSKVKFRNIFFVVA